MKYKKSSWYSLNPKRILKTFLVTIGLIAVTFIFYITLVGIWWPETSQLIHRLQKPKENTSLLQTQQKELLKTQSKLESQWQEKLKQFNSHALLSDVKTVDASVLNCINQKTFWEQEWGLTFQYPRQYVVDYGDTSAPIGLNEGSKNILIYNPSLSDQPKYHPQSIDEYLKKVEANDARLYLTYFDSVTKIKLKNKTIYKLGGKVISSGGIKDVDDLYIEFNNNNCGLSLRYFKSENVLYNDFYCVLNSAEMLCK